MKILRRLATGSAAERFMNCPGSVALGKGIVEAPKTYAEEGTRLHKEVEEALRAFYQEGLTLGDIKNPFVKLCVKTVVEDTLASTGVLSSVGIADLHLEHRLELLGSSGGVDCYWINPTTRTAYLYDWKFGQGVRLEAKGNEQMAFYACAIKEKHPEILRTYVTLIQPRLEGDFEETAHVTHWTMSHHTVRAWRRKFEKALLKVEEASEFRAGEWCKFCAAKPICPAYVAFNHVAQEEQLLPALQAMAETPETIERVAWMLTQEKRVKSWFQKADEWLLELAVRGVKIPFHELVDKRTNRQWHEMMDSQEIAAKLKERGVSNPWHDPELISFTEAEKQGAKVDDLVYKPKAGKTLKLLKI